MSIILAVLLTGCGAGTRTAASSGGYPRVTVIAAAGRARLPALTGRTLEGRPLALRSVATGAVLVINVWASWCSQCRDETPALTRLSSQLKSSGVRFVGLDEQDKAESARAFVRASSVSYPQLLDPDSRLLSQLTELPGDAIPSTLLVDRHGLMSARIIGPSTRAQLQQLIVRVQGEP